MLPYGHPKNVKWRMEWNLQLKNLQIREELILNYDQVWRLKYRGSPTTMAKTGEPGTYQDLIVVCCGGFFDFQAICLYYNKQTKPANTSCKPRMARLGPSFDNGTRNSIGISARI
jgi:hypothetical protein